MGRRATHGTVSRKEPAGRLARAGRYRVQHDVAAPEMWLLALGDDAWLVEGGLPAAPGAATPARRLPPGPRPPGTAWDEGDYRLDALTPTGLTVELSGVRVRGRYQLRASGDAWAISRLDPPSLRPQPTHVLPMLATSGSYPTDEAQFAFEPKWDGVRALVSLRDGAVRIKSRNQLDMTVQYPELEALADALPDRECLLDGEIVAFDERGNPSFQLLQTRLGVTARGVARRRMVERPATYIAFDLLHLDGHDTTMRPYEERRALLESLDLDTPTLRTTPMIVGKGRALLATPGLEGIVAKRLGSPYEPGARSRAWIKVKTTRRQEFVLGGWTPGRGSRRGRIGALLVGVYEGGKLRYAGSVGTGFSERTLDALRARLSPLVQAESPFAEDVGKEDATFVAPRLVAEVEFTEWTRDDRLRHPSFKGLRADKDPREVVKEDA